MCHMLCAMHASRTQGCVPSGVRHARIENTRLCAMHASRTQQGCVSSDVFHASIEDTTRLCATCCVPCTHRGHSQFSALQRQLTEVPKPAVQILRPERQSDRYDTYANVRHTQLSSVSRQSKHGPLQPSRFSRRMNKETQWSKRSLQKGTVIGQLSWHSDWAAACGSNSGMDKIFSCTQHLALSWDAEGGGLSSGVNPASPQGRVYREETKAAVLSHLSHTTVVQSTVMTEARQVTTLTVTPMQARRANPLKLSLGDLFEHLQSVAASPVGDVCRRQTDRQTLYCCYPPTNVTSCPGTSARAHTAPLCFFVVLFLFQSTYEV